jgi:hypothetical protein
MGSTVLFFALGFHFSQGSPLSDLCMRHTDFSLFSWFLIAAMARSVSHGAAEIRPVWANHDFLRGAHESPRFSGAVRTTHKQTMRVHILWILLCKKNFVAMIIMPLRRYLIFIRKNIHISVFIYLHPPCAMCSSFPPILALGVVDASQN